MDAMHGNAAAAQMLAKAAMEEAEAALRVHRVGAIGDLRGADGQADIENRLTHSPREEQGSPDLTLNRGAAGAAGEGLSCFATGNRQSRSVQAGKASSAAVAIS